MMMARHCDAPGCDSWQRVENPGDWLDIYAGDDLIATLCSRWCVARWGAKAEPSEVVGG
ncbi:hypothetical protein [Nocardioides marmoriginsengisoli]|uniref:hypothetical protein n=1 Tax=Nocardioides marmoriginsengisoli TaxID=661483 RepID=UPI001609C1B6|nr:hypothetical protein [Nocardioides marmoriginsengisoli]